MLRKLAGAELCVVYRAAVLRMEQHVLSESVPHMAAVQHYLSEYSSVLPGMHSILYELTNVPNATDAQIMGLLFDRTRSGIPILQAVLERLLWNCNQILYRHISAWYVLLIIFQPAKSRIPGLLLFFQSLRHLCTIAWQSDARHIRIACVALPDIRSFKI